MQKMFAVVTGASSGIGAALAEALAARGMDLAVIARRGERLEALAIKLAEKHGTRTTVMIADLTDAEALRRIENALAELEYVDLLVNCAGFGTYGFFEKIDPERIKQELLLDLVAPVALTRAVLPKMIERKRGNIINVSSMAGFLPIPRHATYCAAKAGLTRFTEVLHGELIRTGVRVHAVCPGPVPTEFFEISGYRVEDVPGYMLQSVRACVEKTLRGASRQRVVFIPQLFIQAFVGVLGFLPLTIRLKILSEGPAWLNGNTSTPDSRSKIPAAK